MKGNDSIAHDRHFIAWKFTSVLTDHFDLTRLKNLRVVIYCAYCAYSAYLMRSIATSIIGKSLLASLQCFPHQHKQLTVRFSVSILFEPQNREIYAGEDQRTRQGPPPFLNTPTRQATTRFETDSSLFIEILNGTQAGSRKLAS